MRLKLSYVPSFALCAVLFACGGLVKEDEGASDRVSGRASGGESSASAGPSADVRGPLDAGDAPPLADDGDGPGFTVRDAWFRDGTTPYGQRVKQIVLASFAGACDPENASIGEKTLFLGLPADREPTVGAVYPITGVQGRWSVLSLACTGMSLEQVHVEGTVTVTNLDDTVVEGTLVGTLLEADGTTRRALSVAFSASRCSGGQGACQP